ncbi:glycerol kinase GlpK [Pseudoalteromonas tunicata]|uniref:Glycerol kinase n=1 Tax=Pseudoalteromonas tunicata D2 TaxID=87626 RepID=A4CEB4_9GAMM|nr:glycerol kinase GlpK [Pseudoalteromonas tunicata]ATC93036.1 glycerol kinase [Pseudoalteromonas tunicata]AXT32119.1 glycerol kinase [Pseudoalteromonas tunicata]EAR26926.1 glycerol kinase [Pseudoalteromonas tunicata D2]MDP4984622.1 glycerol kinase GlpK [Pseudoalteromonas tunicata]
MTTSAIKKYVVALDQGTTSSRTLIFDQSAHLIASIQQEFKQYYPAAGWVEHDAEEIWQSQLSTLKQALKHAEIDLSHIAAIGITNQRETTVIWDKNTGKPVYNAIVWQCRRSNELCQALKHAGHENEIKTRTGLVLDPYFSASKIKWILDNVDGIRARAERGELLFGTIDTWLLWQLTEGKVHVTDPTNASRTMLYNIHQQCWDKTLLALFDIPASLLPTVQPSSAIYGVTCLLNPEQPIPIAGMAGDQQAALFGQQCTDAGSVKNTYGTGCFMLMNTGKQAINSTKGLITTLAIGPDGGVCYALEGSVFMGGAVVQWLRDELGLIQHANETAQAAKSVSDNNGVYLVPAFTGLGAPYWQPDARGTLVGLSRGANRNHIIRAALEAIAYQSHEILTLMSQESGINLLELKVDGGAASNDFLLQFQSDISDITVLRPNQTESTALGAAFLAGLAVGFWPNSTALKHTLTIAQQFRPNISGSQRQTLLRGWRRAIEQTLAAI